MGALTPSPPFTPRFWAREPEPRALFGLEPTPAHSELRAQRDPATGRVLGFAEVSTGCQGSLGRGNLDTWVPAQLSGERWRGSLNTWVHCVGVEGEAHCLGQAQTPGSIV